MEQIGLAFGLDLEVSRAEFPQPVARGSAIPEKVQICVLSSTAHLE